MPQHRLLGIGMVYIFPKISNNVCYIVTPRRIRNSHCLIWSRRKTQIYVYRDTTPACKCHFVCLKMKPLCTVQARRRNNNPSFAVEKYQKRSNNNDCKFLVACFKKRVVSIQENVHKTPRYVFIRFTSDRVKGECLKLARFLLLP